jgi:hypothetical protein
MADPVAVLGDLSALLDVVAQTDLDGLDRPALTAWVCAWPALEAKVQALSAAALDAADRAQVQLAGGQRSIAAFVAAKTRSAPEHLGARHRLGRFLREAPQFAGAVLAGRITLGHVDAMRHALNSRNRPAFIVQEAELVGLAATLAPRDFNQVVQTWDNAADPDGAKPRAQRAKRALTTRKLADGCVEGTFRLDPIAGETLLTAVHLESERLRKADLHLPRGHEPRSAAQRAADALAALVSRGAARNSAAKLPQPLVHLVMSEQIAEQLLAWLDDPSVEIVVDTNGWDRRCHLVDGTPIHPHLAAGALGVGVLRRLVVGAASELMDLGLSVRCFPRHLADAIKTRDGGRCRMRRLRCAPPVARHRPHPAVEPLRPHVGRQRSVWLRPAQSQRAPSAHVMGVSGPESTWKVPRSTCSFSAPSAPSRQ